MENKQVKEGIFSVKICSEKRFKRADRDLLLELVLSEIKNGITMTIDDVFEEQNCEEYIVSDNTISIRKMKNRLEVFSNYCITCAEIAI